MDKKDIKTTPSTETSFESANGTFKTDDLNLASFIKAKGGTIIHIGLSPEDQGRYYFEFKDYEACSKLKYEFMNGGGVIAKEFVDARETFVKEVKSLWKGFQ